MNEVGSVVESDGYKGVADKSCGAMTMKVSGAFVLALPHNLIDQAPSTESQ